MSRERIVVGDRVLLKGKHSWNAHAGEVIEKDMAGRVTVRLDNGREVMAWPRQYQRVWR